MTRRAALAFAMTAAIVYLVPLNGHWAVKSDSALYLSLGRSLAEGRGMEFNGRQVWGILPVVPTLLAACYRLAGGHLWLANLMMACFGLGVVLLVGPVFRRIEADVGPPLRGTAMATAIVVAASARLFIESRHILTDVPLTFLFLVGVYGFVRGRQGHWASCLVGSAAMAAASMVRLPGLVLAGGLALGTLLEFRRPGYARRALATVGGGLLVIGAFVFWLLCLRPRSDPQSLDYFRAASGLDFNLLSSAKIREIGLALANFPDAFCGSVTSQKLPYLNLVPTALVLTGMIVLMRRRQWLLVVPTVMYVGLLAGLAPSMVAARYLLPVMPILVYACLAGVMWAADRVAGRLGGAAADTVSFAAHAVRTEAHNSWARRAVVVAAAFWIVSSAPKLLREAYWMRHPRFYEVYAHGQWKPVIEVAEALARRGRRGTDTVATVDPAIVHYLSRLNVAASGDPRRTGPWEPTRLPPQDYAAQVAAGAYRFVVLPGDRPGWSEAALEALAGTGVFGPPERFGPLILLERQPVPSRP